MAVKANPSLSISQAAEDRGVSDSTIRRLIARGELRAFRVGPRLIRIDPRDLDAAVTEVNPASFAYINGGAE